jgi:integrating conjugative element protein (TIGR03752 family)
MDIRANRVPIFLVILVGLMAVFVGIRSCRTSSESGTEPAVMTAVPQALPPDADSPADTVRTLRANVADMTAKFEAMSQENGRLLEANTHLQRQLANLQRQLNQGHTEATRSQSSLSQLTQRIDALAGNVRTLQTGASRGHLPVGLGLEAADTPATEREKIVWILPVAGGPPSLAFDAHAPAPSGRRQTGLDKHGKVSKAGKKPPLKPAYTLAENMTLAASTAFTALVGRIPLRGRVQDPFPFYVLVGADNLVANGLKLPEVAGIVFRGEAFGDLNLSCVRGDLISATWVFMDGTIRTVRGDKNHPLGTLADEFGIPCVSGRLITDAPQYLSRRVLVSSVGAAGDAAAAAQTTNTISGSTGTTTSTRTGDVAQFIVGRTIRDSAREIERYLEARFRQSWDAIFVRPGTPVSLLIQREMAIDYDPDGRRLTYDTQIDSTHRPHLD